MDREESYKRVVKLAVEMLIQAGLHNPNKGASYSRSFAESQAIGQAADWISRNYGHHIINFVDEGITEIKSSYKWATGDGRGAMQDHRALEQRKAQRIAQKILNEHR